MSYTTFVLVGLFLYVVLAAYAYRDIYLIARERKRESDDTEGPVPEPLTSLGRLVGSVLVLAMASVVLVAGLSLVFDSATFRPRWYWTARGVLRVLYDTAPGLLSIAVGLWLVYVTRRFVAPSGHHGGTSRPAAIH